MGIHLCHVVFDDDLGPLTSEPRADGGSWAEPAWEPVRAARLEDAQAVLPRRSETRDGTRNAFLAAQSFKFVTSEIGVGENKTRARSG